MCNARDTNVVRRFSSRDKIPFWRPEKLRKELCIVLGKKSWFETWISKSKVQNNLSYIVAALMCEYYFHSGNKFRCKKKETCWIELSHICKRLHFKAYVRWYFASAPSRKLAKSSQILRPRSKKWCGSILTLHNMWIKYLKCVQCKANDPQHTPNICGMPWPSCIMIFEPNGCIIQKKSHYFHSSIHSWHMAYWYHVLVNFYRIFLCFQRHLTSSMSILFKNIISILFGKCIRILWNINVAQWKTAKEVTGHFR